ncbi:hypothetical protein BRC19_01255 [Candidatus Saccharibacteria bacterium QS_5_54_17]|nr:MAG: hypothetical protein BRC19_01255 [Candidatus Saccharibacteria bacterium QS_5_54_17]
MFENKNTGTDPETVTSQEIDESFGRARANLMSLVQSPEFHQACAEADVDPFDDTEVAYWQVMQNQAEEVLDSAKDVGEMNETDYQTNRLVFAAPNYVMRQAELEGGDSNPPQNRREAKVVASKFNDAMRDFATAFPEVNASALEVNLQNVVNETMFEEEMIQAGSEYIKQSIRGARHEAAFGQILAQAGFNFRETTIEEDLKGADFMIETGDGEAPLDVKASLSDIEARGQEQQPCTVKPDGTVVIYSHLLDSEFAGKLGISEDKAAEKAEIVAPSLEEALNPDLRPAAV